MPRSRAFPRWLGHFVFLADIFFSSYSSRSVLFYEFEARSTAVRHLHDLRGPNEPRARPALHGYRAAAGTFPVPDTVLDTAAGS